MPGFGFGPFGTSSFGSYPWAFQVFYDLLPSLHKTEDESNDFALRKFAYAVAETWTDLRNKADDFTDLRDALQARTAKSFTGSLTLGKVKIPKGVIESKGIDGSFTTLGEFTAPSGKFPASYKGKILRVWERTSPGKKREFTVNYVIDAQTLAVDPAIATGSQLRWEVETPGVADPTKTVIEISDGLVSEIFPGWSINDNQGEYTVSKRSLFPNIWDKGTPTLLQQESEGAAIIGGGILQDARGRFSAADIGKIVVIRSADDETTPGWYKVAAVPTATSVTLSPTPAITSGVAWAILPRSEITIQGSTLPVGTILKDGICDVVGASATTATIRVDAGVFGWADVGKKLTIAGIGYGHNGTYSITTIVDSFTVVITASGLTVATGLTWELRQATGLGSSLVEVEYHSPSELSELAKDFGLYIDALETETRQRRWVEHSGRWMDKKGSVAAYDAIGDCSGVDVDLSKLYRISPLITLPVTPLEDTEKSGTGGTLALNGLSVQFAAPFGSFSSSDAGKTLKIAGAATGGNNGYYLIETVVDTSTVIVTTSLTTTIPDANNGALSWQVLRLYTTEPPLIPRYDEVNASLLSDIVEYESGGGKEFVADQYCSEDTHRAQARVEVTSITSTSYNKHTVTVVGTVQFPTAPEVVAGVGQWKLISTLPISGNLVGVSITGSAPNMTLTISTSAFTSDMVGKYVNLSGASTFDNSGLFLITSVISGTQLVYDNGQGVAEGFTGVVVIREPHEYFIDTVPTRTGDCTIEIGGTGDSLSNPDIDGYTLLTDAAVTLSAAYEGRFIKLSGISTENDGLFEVVDVPSTTTLKYLNTAVSLGNARSFSTAWKIGLPYYQFEVRSTIAPYIGNAILVYECPRVLSCDYCSSYKMLMTLTPRDELFAEGADAIDSIVDRTVRRLDEVKPAHVEFIIKPQVSFRSSPVGTAGITGVLSNTVWPLTAADMRTAMGGYGTWTSIWPCNETSGILEDVVGSVDLSPLGTPLYSQAGSPTWDKAVGFDSATDAFAAASSASYDIGTTGGLAIYLCWRTVGLMGSDYILTKMQTGVKYYYIAQGSSGRIVFAVYDAAGIPLSAEVTPNHIDGNFHDILAIIDRDSGNVIQLATDLGVSATTSIAGEGTLSNTGVLRLGGTSPTNGRCSFMAIATGDITNLRNNAAAAIASMRTYTGRS